MLASVPINGAAKLLADAGKVTWTGADLLDFLNRAARAVVLVRPDAKTTRGDIALVAGIDQAIPAAGLRLLRITRNQTGRAITLISEEQLTDHDRDWPTATPKTAVKHYMHDPLEPKAFQVYPPAAVGAAVQGVWSVSPTPCANDAATVDLDDIYEPVLVHLICHYAYLRDSEDASNAALAAVHRDTAMVLLAGKTDADAAGDPRATQPNKISPNQR